MQYIKQRGSPIVIKFGWLCNFDEKSLYYEQCYNYFFAEVLNTLLFNFRNNFLTPKTPCSTDFYN